MRPRKYRYFVCVCVLFYIYYFFGVGDYMFSRSYEDEFNYPLNVNVRQVAENIMAGKKPDIKPINRYPYRFLTNSGKCRMLEKLDLLIIVKSAMDHFEFRDAIRQTYGQENFVPGTIIKTLFFLGIEGQQKSELQKKIDNEMAQHKDIIQIDFIDNYYNNTIKTMMSFRWAFENCAIADHYLFTDDDMYISINNLLEFVTDYSTSALKSSMTIYEENVKPKNINMNSAPVLFAGYVFKSTPHRLKSSKWRVSLDEYPWNRWPPYVTAGAYVVSNRALKLFYIGSLYVKHFRFDDIYLGILAKKLDIKPVHNSQFHFYKKEYSKDGYRDVIASHGYHNHDELVHVWNELNSVV